MKSLLCHWRDFVRTRQRRGIVSRKSTVLAAKDSNGNIVVTGGVRRVRASRALVASGKIGKINCVGLRAGGAAASAGNAHSNDNERCNETNSTTN